MVEVIAYCIKKLNMDRRVDVVGVSQGMIAQLLI